MLKIKININHKSIKSSDEFELPKFTKLTGVNGSGKTHLLEVISDTRKSIVKLDGKILKNIKYIKFNGLNPNNIDSCEPSQINNLKKQAWAELNQYIQNTSYKTLTDIQIIGRIRNENHKKFIKSVQEEVEKPLRELNETNFLESFSMIPINPNDIFASQFSVIFKNYHIKKEENGFKNYKKSQGKKIFGEIYTEEEFKEKFGTPPWDFINELLKDLKIPYEVNSPEESHEDAKFTFKLKNTEGLEIDLKDLSTGEKVLMSLALAIYNTGNGMEKPELLILDEPDAPLHPSMTKTMIDVLSKKIIEENNIPVIITTHSPSTVIASQESAIYQLEKGNSIPQKTTVQNAVELLSGEIPFLKISNEKRRQVFVESRYDVQYYESLTNILAKNEKLNSEPIFIPAGSKKGSNCTDVKRIVKNLVENGNDQVYGIIDWDLSNDSSERLVVLGNGKRYAIENYLLDPLKMGLLLLRECFIDISEFNGISIKSYIDANKMNEKDAQLIIDKILQDLDLLSDNKVEYTLYNGWKLVTTKEFNEYQGHSLEKKYKEKYDQLKRYHKEDALKNDVILKVISDFPEYVPNEIFETLRKIK